MQNTPQANRIHIGVFGRRNAGKSSLINALSNQQLALVSSIAGTTTDPVYKAMELLPIGPVVLIDTAGIDDQGELGRLRVSKTIEVIRKTDLAILVIDPETGLSKYEEGLFTKLQDNKAAVVVVINKVDDHPAEIIKPLIEEVERILSCKPVLLSSKEKIGIEELKDCLIAAAPCDYENPAIIADLILPGETIVLVTPIDSAAPKGRLILPQVQTIREILDAEGIAVVCKETELNQTLQNLSTPPAIVVTDSQAFQQVASLVPENIFLTGFSVLFARYKGDLKAFVQGAKALASLKSGDKVLIAEGCTHHRQEDDIGTFKIPRWLEQKFGQLEYVHAAGRDYPQELSDFDLILHCGSCMLNKKEVIGRIREAEEAGVPVVNYGMAIAYLHGILDRALRLFPEAYRAWISFREKEGSPCDAGQVK